MLNGLSSASFVAATVLIAMNNVAISLEKLSNSTASAVLGWSIIKFDDKYEHKVEVSYPISLQSCIDMELIIHADYFYSYLIQPPERRKAVFNKKDDGYHVMDASFDTQEFIGKDPVIWCHKEATGIPSDYEVLLKIMDVANLCLTAHTWQSKAYGDVSSKLWWPYQGDRSNHIGHLKDAALQYSRLKAISEDEK